MSKIDLGGLKIDAITKEQLLQNIWLRLKQNQQTFIITPYSEFLYAALKQPPMLSFLNKADFAVADGVGVVWAAKFLSLPLTVHNFYAKILQALWQIVYSGAAILLWPKFIYTILPQKIVGADLIWDLSYIAEQENLSVYLLGGRGQIAERVAQTLVKKFPKLRVVGTNNKDATDPSIIQDIAHTKPDILFVAFDPIKKQEPWIAHNIQSLPIKLAIGLGGTFDYISGAKIKPPKIIRDIGLEWLFRLITQPSRIVRIKHAFWDLIILLLRYKVFMSCPYRKGVVAIISNQLNQVLICQRNPKPRVSWENDLKKFKNYWQFPQGGINANETLEAAARREATEETGITSLQYLRTSPHTHNYIWHNSQRKLLFSFNDIHQHKGQQQYIVYFKFNGSEKEIKTDNREFVNYKWLSINELATTIHAERLPLVEIIKKDIA